MKYEKKVTHPKFLALMSKGRRLQDSGFTLVELIVVITILAILGTIAFISLQGYSRDARDSIRISDLNTMKTSLELFNLDAGKYASTTDGTIITYSGAEVWTQGYFGDTTTNSVDRLDDTPTDPLTEQEYIYSTTSNKQEFQLAGIMEGSDLGYNTISQTNAGDKIGTINITGNYNGKVLKVSTGGIDYVLAVPSIIGSLSGTLENIIANNGLAYDGYNNLPFQYEGSSYNVLGNTTEQFVNNTNPSDFVLFAGDISDLSSELQVGIDARAGLISGFETAYSGTTIEGVGEIATLISTSAGGDTAAIEFLASTVISNDLGGDIEISTNILGGGLDLIYESCNDILINDPSKLNNDGVYTIDPELNGIGFEVYCDMTSDLGGWTLLSSYNRSTGGNEFHISVVEVNKGELNYNPYISTPIDTNSYMKLGMLPATMVKYDCQQPAFSRVVQIGTDITKVDIIKSDVLASIGGNFTTWSFGDNHSRLTPASSVGLSTNGLVAPFGYQTPDWGIRMDSANYDSCAVGGASYYYNSPGLWTIWIK